jgi:glycosyltransferase involved in cell wall biosynthesis
VSWKGIHVLVEAIERLNSEGLQPQLRVIIAGGTFHEDASYERDLAEHAAKTVPNVEFVGHQADVAGLLSDADVLVSCSLAAEPFGQVIAQGLAAGRPVIATDIGGPREMITDTESGFLIEPDAPLVLAERIRFLLDHPTEAQAMGRIARRSAERFSDARTTAGLLDAIGGLVSAITSEHEQRRLR